MSSPRAIDLAWRGEDIGTGSAAERRSAEETTDTLEVSPLGRVLAEQAEALTARPSKRVSDYASIQPGVQDTAGNPGDSTHSAKLSLPDDSRTDASKTSPEEEREVQELQRRDREVRRHEQAHAAAAGQYARGGPSYEFVTGPDGQRYASGGEVNIDTTPVADDPQATVAKMQQVRRAALAPASPSSQDRAVAAKAQAQEQKARAEIARNRRDSEAVGRSGTDNSPKGSTLLSPGSVATDAQPTIGALLDLTG